MGKWNGYKGLLQLTQGVVPLTVAHVTDFETDESVEQLDITNLLSGQDVTPSTAVRYHDDCIPGITSGTARVRGYMDDSVPHAGDNLTHGTKVILTMTGPNSAQLVVEGNIERKATMWQYNKTTSFELALKLTNFVKPD